MLDLLAVMAPPILALFIVTIVVIITILVVTLKKSKSVDKLNENLFKPIEENTVDDYIDKIKEGKDGLVEKSKEVTKTIAEKTKEQMKINKNL